jgi:hypothetical protein
MVDQKKNKPITGRRKESEGMKISEMKQKILTWEDFYGGDILDSNAVKKARTKEELKGCLERHRQHMDDMANDACRHLDRFAKELGL